MFKAGALLLLSSLESAMNLAANYPLSLPLEPLYEQKPKEGGARLGVVRDPSVRVRQAVRDNNVPLLSRLQYKYDLRNTDRRRLTSLAWAALELNLEVFEWLLLDYGHDDHELSRDGAHNTIFHLLAAVPAPPALSPNREIWAGAPDFPPRVQTRSQEELTDICLRMTEVYYTLFPFLLDWSNSAGETALHIAAQADNAPFIAVLVELGADVNLADLDGNTPLHTASAWGHVECIKVLLERGATIGLRNFENFTAADVAYSNATRSAFDQMAREAVELRRQRRQQQREVLEDAEYDYDGGGLGSGGRWRSGSGSTASQHTGSRSSSHSYSDHPLPPLPIEDQPPMPPLPPEMQRYNRAYSYDRAGSPTPQASRQGSEGSVQLTARPPLSAEGSVTQLQMGRPAENAHALSLASHPAQPEPTRQRAELAPAPAAPVSGDADEKSRVGRTRRAHLGDALATCAGGSEG